MDLEMAPCLACGEAAPTEASVCQGCGYDLAIHDRRRRWLGTLGTAMCLSVVLSPIGLPLLWLAYRHRLAAEGTVTDRPEAAVGVHLRRVIGHHLGLEPNDPRRAGRSPSRREGADASQR